MTLVVVWLFFLFKYLLREIQVSLFFISKEELASLSVAMKW